MLLAYREITSVINHQVNLTLPDYIKSERVEIIIIPYYNPQIAQTKKVDFNKYFGISNVGLSSIENYLKNVRNEWDRAILD